MVAEPQGSGMCFVNFAVIQQHQNQHRKRGRLSDVERCRRCVHLVKRLFHRNKKITNNSRLSGLTRSEKNVFGLKRLEPVTHPAPAAKNGVAGEFKPGLIAMTDDQNRPEAAMLMERLGE